MNIASTNYIRSLKELRDYLRDAQAIETLNKIIALGYEDMEIHAFANIERNCTYTYRKTTEQDVVNHINNNLIYDLERATNMEIA